MAEIQEENEQRDEVYQDVQLWVSAKEKVNTKSTGMTDQVLLKIQKRLDKYSRSLWECERQIYSDTEHLGNHTPILVTIGSNYRGTIKPDLMEVHKLKYLKDFVQRIGSTVERLVRDNFMALLQVALNPLGGENEFTVDLDIELIETFVLDGCFIIELFLKNVEKKQKARDLLFKSEWILCVLSRDLIVPGNQLSLRFLSELCKHWRQAVKLDQDDGFKLTRLAAKFLKRIAPIRKLNYGLVDTGDVNDFTSILHNGLNWSPALQVNNKKDGDDLPPQKEKYGDDNWKLEKCATELGEYGIRLRKTKTNGFNDLEFMTHGVLKIPHVRIRYGTTYAIKVLLSYEQNYGNHRQLTNYLWFINNLVKSPEDVKLLCQKMIIDNLSELFDEAAIHRFLKDICKFIMIPRDDANYIQIYKGLNLYCSAPSNLWRAQLTRDYFGKPMKSVTLFLTLWGLGFTFTQTVLSIASYVKEGS